MQYGKMSNLYCGMSGRSIENARKAGKKKYGLITRLNSHASGRLSGDQFCVYVANRLVIPSITSDMLPQFTFSSSNAEVFIIMYDDSCNN